MKRDQELSDANRMLDSSGQRLYVLENENERLLAKVERLEAVIAATANRIDKLASEIPPPNMVTPDLMMVAIGLRQELSR